jgi:hypothetical protein
VTPSDCRSSNHSVKTLVSCSCSIGLSLAFYRVGSIDRGELCPFGERVYEPGAVGSRCGS